MDEEGFHNAVSAAFDGVSVHAMGSLEKTGDLSPWLIQMRGCDMGVALTAAELIVGHVYKTVAGPAEWAQAVKSAGLKDSDWLSLLHRVLDVSSCDGAKIRRAVSSSSASDEVALVFPLFSAGRSTQLILNLHRQMNGPLASRDLHDMVGELLAQARRARAMIADRAASASLELDRGGTAGLSLDGFAEEIPVPVVPKLPGSNSNALSKIQKPSAHASLVNPHTRRAPVKRGLRFANAKKQ